MLFSLVSFSATVSGNDTILVRDMTEYQVTSTSAYETTLTLGADVSTYIVVYSVIPQVEGAPGAGDIWYQRLDRNGAPFSSPIQVTSAPTDDIMNDVSGDYIVYTAHESTISYAGTIMLYQISTGNLQPL